MTSEWFPPEIVRATLIDGKLEVVIKQRSTGIQYGSASGRVWKEIYHAVDGKIELAKRVVGHYTPTRLMPEEIYFDEQ